jgi:hypothetical protein
LLLFAGDAGVVEVNVTLGEPTSPNVRPAAVTLPVSPDMPSRIRSVQVPVALLVLESSRSDMWGVGKGGFSAFDGR